MHHLAIPFSLFSIFIFIFIQAKFSKTIFFTSFPRRLGYVILTCYNIVVASKLSTTDYKINLHWTHILANFEWKSDEYSMQKVGVMGYVNLSYYIGKTPKMVLGQRKFCGPVQRSSRLGRRKILGSRNLDSFYFWLKFGP